MQSAVDSFIQYMSTELAQNPAVSYVRASAAEPTSADLRMDALNISALGFYEIGSSEYALVSLDLLGSEEREVMAWTKRVRDLLLERQYTPELDYELDPEAPPSTGRFVSWSAGDIKFGVVAKSARVLHVNATFQILHVRF